MGNKGLSYFHTERTKTNKPKINLLTASPLFDRHVAPARLGFKQTLMIITLAVTTTYGFHSIRAFLFGLTHALRRAVTLYLTFGVIRACYEFTWICEKKNRIKWLVRRAISPRQEGRIRTPRDCQ